MDIDHRDPTVLQPDEAKDLLDRSNLPNGELAQIWQLSDADADSQLTLLEFAYAMHLVSRRLQGFDLPDALPSELLTSMQRLLGAESQITDSMPSSANFRSGA